MRVLIVEPDLTGHHAPYLRHMIRGLAELEQRPVVLTSRSASQTQQFAIHLQDVAADATWDESLAPASTSLRYAREFVGGLQEAVRRHRIDHVWVAYADIVSLYLGARALLGWRASWPADVETEALCFRSTFAYPAPQWNKSLSRTVSQLFLPRANWDILHFVDPIPCELIRQRLPEQAGRFRVMPDPVESVRQVEPEFARREMGIPTSGRLVGCMGVLNDQWAIERLLSAFRQAKLDAEDRLLLAGPMGTTVRSCVEADFGDLVRSGRILTIDRHLNLDEVMLAVMASDVVCVPTKFRMGSSSFIVRAAAAGKPVVADDFGWTGWAIDQFDLGWSVDVRNISQFADTLQAALENANLKTGSPATDRFVCFHSAENFKAHWTSRLRERLGLSPDPNFVPWQSVIEESVAVQS